MQKKILFYYSIFNIGGAEKSILRLGRALIENGWEVTFVFLNGGGELETQIDKRISVFHLRPKEKGLLFKNAKGARKIQYAFDAFLYGVYSLLGKIRQWQFLFRKYDMAVVSLHGLSPKFVCRYVNAKVKIQWIRNDLCQCDPDEKAYNNIQKHLSCIDRYVCVSQTALESLNTLFPEVSNRSEVIYNILDPDEMIRLAESETDPFADYADKLKVITVCRLSNKAKGLLRMVNVHQRLNEEGIDFYWFIIGDGPDKAMLQDAIDNAGLHEKMILLGSKANPYPYFKAADISATLSYYEGLCGAVNEAKVLGKPVIATEFSGIYEQIHHNETGLIVGNDENSIMKGMVYLLQDDKLRKKLSQAKLPDLLWNDDCKIKSLEKIVL